MSSRKLIALDFIKRYFNDWGKSPTLGELSAELGVSRKRAYDLVHQLADEHMIEREPGQKRGIRLLDRNEELSEADVLLLLSARGWTIGRGPRMVLPPEKAVGAALVQGLTEKGLPELAELDHHPAEAAVGNHGSETEVGGGRKAGAAQGARRAADGQPDGVGQATP